MADALTRRGLMAGAAAGSVLLLTRPTLGQGYPPPEAVFNDPDAPVLGNRDGDVTIVEWFDYQCPYCKANHPMLEEEIARDGKIRLVMKDFPIFGPPSVRASRLVLGATAIGAYKPALEALMATEGKLSEAQVDGTLMSAGVDLAGAEAGYRAEAGRWDGLIARNMQQAEAFGLMGTPSYLVGFTLFPGVIDRATLRTALSEARA